MSLLIYNIFFQPGVSQERIEIDPYVQPKAAKKFWGKQKAVSIYAVWSTLDKSANFAKLRACQSDVFQEGIEIYESQLVLVYLLICKKVARVSFRFALNHTQRKVKHH